MLMNESKQSHARILLLLLLLLLLQLFKLLLCVVRKAFPGYDGGEVGGGVGFGGVISEIWARN
jgi:hypothetical protein